MFISLQHIRDIYDLTYIANMLSHDSHASLNLAYFIYLQVKNITSGIPHDLKSVAQTQLDVLCIKV